MPAGHAFGPGKSLSVYSRSLARLMLMKMRAAQLTTPTTSPTDDSGPPPPWLVNAAAAMQPPTPAPMSGMEGYPGSDDGILDREKMPSAVDVAAKNAACCATAAAVSGDSAATVIARRLH